MNNESANKVEVILVACLIMCVLFLCLYRLEIYPAPWFDEGLVLQAAKNMAFTGRYELCSTEGCVKFHPAIQTGPTVLLPMALVFRFGGAGILQSRLLIVAYAILALAIFYWLVRTLCDRKVAFLASLLLIFTFDHEFTSFVLMGRQVLAEIPALAFFWLGTFVWIRAWQGSRWLGLVWAGLLWGLAMLTKVQFALMLPVTLVVFWLFDRISSKRLAVHHIVVPMLVSGGCMLIWYGYQIFSLGFADFWQQTMALGSAGGLHFLHFSPRRTVSAILQLMDSSLLILGLPGMLYVVLSSLQSGAERERQQVFLVVFVAVWLGWYAFLSIGWMRYAFVPAVMSTIFSARLLGDLWNWAGQRRRMLARWLPLTSGQVAVGGMIVMLLISGLVPMAKRIAESPDSGLQDLAQYLNAHIPTEAVIESWEWEVDLLTDHAYHHPPYDVTNAFTEHLWYGTPVSPDMYDPMDFYPEYLIVGRFAKWTGVYSQELCEQRSTLVKSFGEYDLYKIHTDVDAER
jgi:4-amino-4-deoxy-L-arabinose transferase-like glycosyltransferase